MAKDNQSPAVNNPASELVEQRKLVEDFILESRLRVHEGIEREFDQVYLDRFLYLQRQFGLARLITLIALS